MNNNRKMQMGAFILGLTLFGLVAAKITSNRLTIGKGVAEDITLEFDKGLGGTNPVFKWNNVGDQLEFSNDGSVFSAIGSGSGGGLGKNYVLNGDGELGTDDITVSNGTDLTLTLETLNPMFDLNSLKFETTATTGTADFDLDTIDNAIIDGGFVLYVESWFKTDGNAATGDWRFGVYNTTDSEYVAGPVDLAIEDDDQRLIVGGFIPAVGKTYVGRLEFTDTTASRTVLVDRLSITSTPLPSSPIVTAWKPYTFVPTDNVGTPVYTGTLVVDQALYRRVGSQLELTAMIRQDSAGTAGTGNYRYPIPAGLTIDGSKLTINTNPDFATIVGSGRYNTGSLSGMHGYLTAESTTLLNFSAQNEVNKGVIGSSFGEANQGLQFSIKASVPIAEWNDSGLTITTDSKPAQTRTFDDTEQTIVVEGGSGSVLNAEMRAFRDSRNVYWMHAQIYWNAGSAVTEHNLDFPGVTFGENRGGAWGYDSAGVSNMQGSGLSSSNQMTVKGSSAFQFGRGGFISRLAGKPTWWDEYVEASQSASTVIEQAGNERPGLLSNYEQIELELDNDWNSGNRALFITKIGNLVNIYGPGEAIYAVAGATKQTSVGFIPERFRPTGSAKNNYAADASGAFYVEVNSAGTLIVTTRTGETTPANRGSSDIGMTLTYRVD